jgi:hypothetical protein
MVIDILRVANRGDLAAIAGENDEGMNELRLSWMD